MNRKRGVASIYYDARKLQLSIQVNTVMLTVFTGGLLFLFTLPWVSPAHPSLFDLNGFWKSHFFLKLCWINFEVPYPGGTVGKEPVCQCRRHKRCGFHPWVGKIRWSRKWQPTPVFLPGESPWTEEPDGLQSMESPRVGHD